VDRRRTKGCARGKDDEGAAAPWLTRRIRFQPDVDLLYDINGLAKAAPHWFDRGMEFVGEYGLLLAMVLLVLWCWWTVRRRATATAASSVAALVWAPLAAGIAVLVNVPIRGFVERPRPSSTIRAGRPGLRQDRLLLRQRSRDAHHGDGRRAVRRQPQVRVRRDRARAARRLLPGLHGVHYPTDVIGGFALGTAVALLLTPLAMALLTP